MGQFRISRSTLSQIDMVQVTLRRSGFEGRGECRPYARYNDTVKSVTAQLESIRDTVENGLENQSLTAERLTDLLPAGPALNALDCALWDLRAKTEGRPIWEILGTPPPQARKTAFTLSLDTPDNMKKAALEAKAYPLLKLKIGDQDALNCVKTVSAARPDAKLIIDANEAIKIADLKSFHASLSGLNIALVEQPLPAGQDGPKSLPNGLPYCADESLHSASDLRRLKAAGYRAVNVKLDKCGGISAALTLMQDAKSMGFDVMAGCMVGSSLAMAPMMILESFADYIDLDGPLLLAQDCEYGLQYDGPFVHPPIRKLWG